MTTTLPNRPLTHRQAVDAARKRRDVRTKPTRITKKLARDYAELVNIDGLPQAKAGVLLGTTSKKLNKSCKRFGIRVVTKYDFDDLTDWEKRARLMSHGDVPYKPGPVNTIDLDRLF